MPGVMWICLQNNKQLFDSRLKGEKCCKSEKNLEPAILGLQKSDVGNHFCASHNHFIMASLFSMAC